MIRRYISEKLGFAVSDCVSRFDAANCAILVDYPLIIELNTAINRATFLIGKNGVLLKKKHALKELNPSAINCNSDLRMFCRVFCLFSC